MGTPETMRLNKQQEMKNNPEQCAQGESGIRWLSFEAPANVLPAGYHATVFFLRCTKENVFWSKIFWSQFFGQNNCRVSALRVA
jgi:hypothetical protein